MVRVVRAIIVMRAWKVLPGASLEVVEAEFFF
jgi:hypothetical protein